MKGNHKSHPMQIVSDAITRNEWQRDQGARKTMGWWRAGRGPCPHRCSEVSKLSFQGSCICIHIGVLHINRVIHLRAPRKHGGRKGGGYSYSLSRSISLYDLSACLCVYVCVCVKENVFPYCFWLLVFGTTGVRIKLRPLGVSVVGRSRSGSVCAHGSDQYTNNFWLINYGRLITIILII